jgi:hypothetical protein
MNQEPPSMIPRLMRRLRSAVWSVLGFSILAWAFPSSVLGQISAVESARRLKPAEGLEATLWASEPMLVNPTNIFRKQRWAVPT